MAPAETTVCLEQARSSLAQLKESIRALAVDPGAPTARDEAHRLVRTLRQAAVGAEGLERLAACMASALDRAPAGAELPRPLVAALAAAVER